MVEDVDNIEYQSCEEDKDMNLLIMRLGKLLCKHPSITH